MKRKKRKLSEEKRSAIVRKQILLMPDPDLGNYVLDCLSADVDIKQIRSF